MQFSRHRLRSLLSRKSIPVTRVFLVKVNGVTRMFVPGDAGVFTRDRRYAVQSSKGAVYDLKTANLVSRRTITTRDILIDQTYSFRRELQRPVNKKIGIATRQDETTTTASIPPRHKPMKKRKLIREAKKKIAGNLCVNTGQGSGGGFTSCNKGASSGQDTGPAKVGTELVGLVRAANAKKLITKGMVLKVEHHGPFYDPNDKHIPLTGKHPVTGKIVQTKSIHTKYETLIVKKTQAVTGGVRVHVQHSSLNYGFMFTVGASGQVPYASIKVVKSGEEPKAPKSKAKPVVPDLAKKQRVPDRASNDGKNGWVSMANMKKIGPQGGSNPGALYKDANGRKWYIKTPKDEERARNEMLASKLYELAGIRTPRLALVKDHPSGKMAVASRIIDGLSENPSLLKSGGAKGVKRGFGMDAWLANWDVVGLTFDNLLVDKKGQAVRLDTGGALRFRAQGSPKGSAFGNTVTELSTMRNPSKSAGRVFKNMTDTDVQKAVLTVMQIPKNKIIAAVKKWGPKDEKTNRELINTLMARRADMAKQVGLNFLEMRYINAAPMNENSALRRVLRGDALDERRKKIKGNLCVNTGTGSGGGFVPCNKGASGRVDKASLLQKRKMTAKTIRDARAKLRKSLKANDVEGVRKALRVLGRYSQTKDTVHYGSVKGSISGFLSLDKQNQELVVSTFAKKMRDDSTAKAKKSAPTKAKMGGSQTSGAKKPGGKEAEREASHKKYIDELVKKKVLTKEHAEAFAKAQKILGYSKDSPVTTIPKTNGVVLDVHTGEVSLVISLGHNTTGVYTPGGSGSYKNTKHLVGLNFGSDAKFGEKLAPTDAFGTNLKNPDNLNKKIREVETAYKKALNLIEKKHEGVMIGKKEIPGKGVKLLTADQIKKIKLDFPIDVDNVNATDKRKLPSLSHTVKTWRDVMTPSELKAIGEYTNGKYHTINQSLHMSNGTSGGSNHDTVKALVSGIMKGNGNMPPNTLVFRGDRMRESYMEAIKAYKAGGDAIFESTTVMSTSLKMGVATGFVKPNYHTDSPLYGQTAILRIRTNGQGTFAKAASTHSGENEAIFVPGHKFQIVGATRVKNRWIIDMVAVGYENRLKESQMMAALDIYLMEKLKTVIRDKVTDFGRKLKPGQSSLPDRYSSEVPWNVSIYLSDDPSFRRIQTKVIKDFDKWGAFDHVK